MYTYQPIPSTSWFSSFPPDPQRLVRAPRCVPPAPGPAPCHACRRGRPPLRRPSGSGRQSADEFFGDDETTAWG